MYICMYVQLDDTLPLSYFEISVFLPFTNGTIGAMSSISFCMIRLYISFCMIRLQGVNYKTWNSSHRNRLLFGFKSSCMYVCIYCIVYVRNVVYIYVCIYTCIYVCMYIRTNDQLTKQTNNQLTKQTNEQTNKQTNKQTKPQPQQQI